MTMTMTSVDSLKIALPMEMSIKKHNKDEEHDAISFNVELPQEFFGLVITDQLGFVAGVIDCLSAIRAKFTEEVGASDLESFKQWLRTEKRHVVPMAIMCAQGTDGQLKLEVTIDTRGLEAGPGAAGVAVAMMLAVNSFEQFGVVLYEREQKMVAVDGAKSERVH